MLLLIKNPCSVNPSNLGCRYYQSYGELPLDFNNKIISEEAKVFSYLKDKNKLFLFSLVSNS
jgi:hypothetical protein